MSRVLNKDVIKQALKRKGMTQIDLADHLKVSQSAIAHYLSGRIMPTNDKLEKISELLNIPHDNMIAYEKKYDDLMMELQSMWWWLSMAIGHRDRNILALQIEMVKSHLKLDNVETSNANERH